MYKTQPFFSQKIWGHEEWVVSAMPEGECTVNGKPLSSLTGADFPLLVKVIQADETLSVQVHPDDSYAAAHSGVQGKTECWYILDAKQGAKLICGLNRKYSADELRRALHDGNIAGCLRCISVKAGDFIYIPAGTVHAICGGLRLLEVQQPSDTTFRLYDWGRGRETHIEESLAVIRHGTQALIDAPFCGTFSCKHFTLQKKEYMAAAKLSFLKESIWNAAFVISGSADFVSGTERIAAATGDTLLVRQGESVKIEPHGSVALMQISQ